MRVYSRSFSRFNFGLHFHKLLLSLPKKRRKGLLRLRPAVRVNPRAFSGFHFALHSHTKISFHQLLRVRSATIFYAQGLGHASALSKTLKGYG
jgi:hypothetical protein